MIANVLFKGVITDGECPISKRQYPFHVENPISNI